MNLSKELIEKAKQAKTVEELSGLAKAENIELSADEAARIFAKLNENGELSDEELDNVSGGGCGTSGKYPKFEVGQTVYKKSTHEKATITNNLGKQGHFLVEYRYIIYVSLSGRIGEEAWESDLEAIPT